MNSRWQKSMRKGTFERSEFPVFYTARIQENGHWLAVAQIGPTVIAAVDTATAKIPNTFKDAVYKLRWEVIRYYSQQGTALLVQAIHQPDELPEG